MTQHMPLGTPVLEVCEANGWSVTQIINTHWHPDHTDGNLDVKAEHDAIVTGPVTPMTHPLRFSLTRGH